MPVIKTLRTGEPVWAELQSLRVALGLRTMDQVLQHLLTVRRQHMAQSSPRQEDAVLALSGLGKEAWKGVDADAYVEELREGW